MKRSAAAVLLCLVILPLPAFAALPPEDNLAAPLQAPRLFDTVHVRRYVHDIPHIFAKNDRDALFALGWIHAEDRCFQMDLLRRTFSGTLVELVGKDALASDVQLCTLGLRRAAEASLTALSRSTEVWLESYARGVNAWLADTSHSLAAEYSLLELTRASIPAWTPVDSIVILKGVTFRLLTDINRNVALFAFQEPGEATGFNGAVLFSEDVYRSAPFDPTASIPTRLREPWPTIPASWRRWIAWTTGTSARPRASRRGTSPRHPTPRSGAAWPPRIYSVWGGHVVQRVIDGTLASVDL
jgi:penicillin G amidase